ncbi:MAG: RnfABCDGE type electron transport complex subunit D [Candidatus Izimaplasma sp.]|nr:RnfABCDGE type electron transport complex subunit D [Candidatus Izimaplasma bacterium]
MEFITKKPPIVRNSQRTYKRSMNLHFALIIIAIAAVVLKAFTSVPEFLAGEATYTALDQSFKVFLMLAVGAFTSVVIELFYSLSEGSTKKFDSYKGFVDPINTGLIIALLLPTVTPIYVLVLAVVVGVYAGKLVFGGYGYYIFNPALIGVLFANISFSAQLGVGDTPLKLLKRALNGETFNITNMTELFIGNYDALAIGTTSVILLAIIFVYLLVTRVIDIRISGTFLLTVLIMSFGIGFINFYMAGNMTGVINYVLINLVTGFTLFAAVFLISEPVSSPTSRETKMIYAVVVAVLMMLVRILGNETEGIVFAILFGNMITPFINRTVKRSDKKSFLKTSLILLFSVLFITISIGFILQAKLIGIYTFIGGIL